jgi:hypothetical protein
MCNRLHKRPVLKAFGLSKSIDSGQGQWNSLITYITEKYRHRYGFAPSSISKYPTDIPIVQLGTNIA